MKGILVDLVDTAFNGAIAGALIGLTAVAAAAVAHFVGVL